MSQFFNEIPSSNSQVGATSSTTEAAVIVIPDGPNLCVNCDVPFPQLQCVDCTCESKERIYCTECSQIHSKLKAYKGHNFQPITRPSAGSHKKCEHGRETRSCKQCGGSRICEHGKYKTICRTCGGNNICQHMKVKRHCIECDGSGLCEHKRQKRSCKECKGIPYKKNRDPFGPGSHNKCDHNRERRSCKECGGNRVCIHGRFKYACRDCGTGVSARKRAALNNLNNNTSIEGGVMPALDTKMNDPVTTSTSSSSSSSSSSNETSISNATSSNTSSTPTTTTAITTNTTAV